MELALMVDSLISSLVIFINKIGYLGIFLGMFLESTPFPLPSELIMIPAGISASQGFLNIYLAILFGVLGNVLGAIFSYFIAVIIGRPILFKVGKYFFLTKQKIAKIEVFFIKHGKISVFIGRLTLGLRHIISLFAGVVKMDFRFFCFYTFFGSFIWTVVLTILGYFIGENQDLIKEYAHILVVAGILFCIGLLVIYSVINRKKNSHIV